MHLTVRRYTDIAGMSAILVVTVGLLAGRRHQLAQAVEFGTRFSWSYTLSSRRHLSSVSVSNRITAASSPPRFVVFFPLTLLSRIVSALRFVVFTSLTFLFYHSVVLYLFTLLKRLLSNCIQVLLLPCPTMSWKPSGELWLSNAGCETWKTEEIQRYPTLGPTANQPWETFDSVWG